MDEWLVVDRINDENENGEFENDTENGHLSFDEERDYINIINTSDHNSLEYQDAMNILINTNIGALTKEVRHFHSRTGAPFHDLLAEAKSGYAKGIMKFDPERKNGLKAYAIWWARRQMQDYIHKNARIKMPMNLVRKIMQYKELLERSETPLTRDEIKGRLNVSEKDMRKIEISSNISTVSLDHNIGDGESSYMDIIQDENINSPIQAIMELERQEALYTALATLEPLEQEIIKGQFLSDEKVTMTEIAERHELTSARIQQKKVTALKKLRGKMQELLST